MKSSIGGIIEEHIETAKQLKSLEKDIEEVCHIIISCLQKANKLMIFGNGGSAADSQHMAAEFINQFLLERKPFAAIALTTDTSVITSIGNDVGYQYVLSKQIQALGNDGDVLIVITTSDYCEDGHSLNLALGLQKARNKNVKTIGFVSKKSKKILELLDMALIVPSTKTPRIQEMQLLIGHIICEIVEKRIINKY